MSPRFTGRDCDRRSGRSVILPAIAGVLAIVGVILLVIPDKPASFGWVAYVPLSSTVFAPTASYWSQVHVFGAILLILGLGALVFWLGVRIGRRSRSTGTPSR